MLALKSPTSGKGVNTNKYYEGLGNYCFYMHSPCTSPKITLRYFT